MLAASGTEAIKLHDSSSRWQTSHQVAAGRSGGDWVRLGVAEVKSEQIMEALTPSARARAPVQDLTCLLEPNWFMPTKYLICCRPIGDQGTAEKTNKKCLTLLYCLVRSWPIAGSTYWVGGTVHCKPALDRIELSMVWQYTYSPILSWARVCSRAVVGSTSCYGPTRGQ